MPNHRKNKDTEIKVRCTSTVKDCMSKKLIACGYIYPRNESLLANFAEFLEALNGKDLEWFKNNFGKTLDK